MVLRRGLRDALVRRALPRPLLALSKQEYKMRPAAGLSVVYPNQSFSGRAASPLSHVYRQLVGQPQLPQRVQLPLLQNRCFSEKISPPSASGVERQTTQTEAQQRPAQDAAVPAAAAEATNSKKAAATEAERQRLAENAARAQRLWDLLVPDKNMSFFSPGFWILLFAVVSLHLYNNERDRQQAQLGAVLSAEESRQLMLAEGARMRRQQQYEQEIQRQQQQQPQ